MDSERFRVIAVHAVTLYQAICHECDWQGELWEYVADADYEADRHECKVDEV